MRITGNAIAITGATNGIGRALFELLRDTDNDLVVCGRDDRALRHLAAHSRISVMRADLAEPGDVEAFADLCIERGVNVLVNNAGTVHHVDWKDGDGFGGASHEMAVNVLAPMRLTARLLPSLQARAEAALVNVTSALAYMPLASAPGYSASKAAMNAFTRSLRHQLRGTSVRTIEILPPAVATKLADGIEGPKVTPERVARAILHAVAKDKLEVRIGLAHALFVLSRLAPSMTFAAINRNPPRPALPAPSA